MNGSDVSLPRLVVSNDEKISTACGLNSSCVWFGRKHHIYFSCCWFSQQGVRDPIKFKYQHCGSLEVASMIDFKGTL